MHSRFTATVGQTIGASAMNRRLPVRTTLLWLLIAALLCVKALVPSGWMPVAGQDGVRIALCTGAGPVVAVMDADGKVHKDAPGHETPRETCPYGMPTTGAALPDLPVLAPLLEPQALPQPVLRAVAIAPYPHGPRPPTRGPPPLA